MTDLLYKRKISCKKLKENKPNNEIFVMLLELEQNHRWCEKRADGGSRPGPLQWTFLVRNDPARSSFSLLCGQKP
jgi:hypothetical protein